MNSIVFRSAKEDDLEDIYHLAESAGVGMTTLPKDKALLNKRLMRSIVSFNKKVDYPCDEYYLFVLEDVKNNKVVGTAAIEAYTGYDAPIYSYKLSKRTRICHELNIRNDYEVLSLVNDNQSQSEICTLFLDPAYRINHHGVLLSCARFLFIANYPQRFARTIIAELRGVSDEEGHSPFWDHVGAHFFRMSFAEADRLSIATNKQFIADLMPRHPVYVKLLAQEAQDVIGKPHPSSAAAMNILLKEGFHFNNYVDIFDAGPTIEAPRDLIATIAHSKVFTVNDLLDDDCHERFIIANTQLDYRATLGSVVFNEQQNSCTLSNEVANLLQIKLGDKVRISPLGSK
jgi:arginine N-succinyltransferase